MSELELPNINNLLFLLLLKLEEKKKRKGSMSKLKDLINSLKPKDKSITAVLKREKTYNKDVHDFLQPRVDVNRSLKCQEIIYKTMPQKIH